MALIKQYELESGIVCNYHTPIILQDNRKRTMIAISSFLNKQAYLDGKAPLRSRVDSISIDSKYPTVEEIYAKVKESRIQRNVIQEAKDAVPAQEERIETYTDEEGQEQTVTIPAVEGVDAVEEIVEEIETNWFADAEDDL